MKAITNCFNGVKVQKYVMGAALIGVMLSVSAAQAAPPTSINAREKEQHKRIEVGKKSGQLTHEELLRLQAREAKVRYKENRNRLSGGKLTAAERTRLEKELNRDSKAIHNQKHDSQHAK